jgi:hypothetical protein
MKLNLINHNLSCLVIKLCDVIQWENPKSMLGCKLSNSFVDQFPICFNTFIFQVFSNLLCLHLFIFLMSIWTTWMLQLPSQLWCFGKIKPTILLFNPWLPYKWFQSITIFHIQCNHNRGSHVNYAQWHNYLLIWMQHVHIMWCNSMLLERFKCKFESETNKKKELWYIL